MVGSRRVEGAPLYTEVADLYDPGLEALGLGLKQNLQSEFEHVDVCVCSCPDLRQDPFGLPFTGIGGDPRLVDIGGVPNLLDPRFHDLSFAIADIVRCTRLAEESTHECGAENNDQARIAVLGASAADANFVGCNGELMPAEAVDIMNYPTSADAPLRSSFSATIKHDACHLQPYPHGRIGFLGNLLISRGLSASRVLKITASGHRTASSFMIAVRTAVAAAFPNRAVGLGGVFTMQSGTVRAHVMPDFKTTVMEDGDEVNEWLRFFRFEGSEATFLTTTLTQDPTDNACLNLRLEHTHFFNARRGIGGHYHNGFPAHDSAEKTYAKYVAYLVPARKIFRIENAFDRSRCSPTLQR